MRRFVFSKMASLITLKYDRKEKEARAETVFL